mgnify:CR=1 FL=1
MLPNNTTEPAPDTKLKTQDLNDLMTKLSKEQNQELNQYMDRIKQEYLMKILEQVNLQNTEYFENLACEYTLQLQMLENGTVDKSSYIME